LGSKNERRLNAGKVREMNGNWISQVGYFIWTELILDFQSTL
jgi:hypothetical protein